MIFLKVLTIQKPCKTLRWFSIHVTGTPEGEVREQEKYLHLEYSNNGWVVSKINDKHKASFLGILENAKQDKHQTVDAWTYHIQLKKTKGILNILKKTEGGNIPCL